MAIERNGSDAGGRQQGTLEEFERRIRNADRFGNLLTSIPKWAAFAVIAWQATLSIVALSARDSLASFLTRFGRETSVWELICWLAGLLGVLYGLYSGHLLRSQITSGLRRLESLERRMATLPSAIIVTNDGASEASDRR